MMIKPRIQNGTWVTFWRVADVVFKILLMALAYNRLHSQPRVVMGAFGPEAAAIGEGGTVLNSFLGQTFSGTSSAGNITMNSGLGAYLAVAGKTTGVSAADRTIPSTYTLSQNYPNPFNPSTSVQFGLPQTSKVVINVYDILGRETATILAADLPAGYHTIRYSPQNLASGVYFYRIVATRSTGGTFIDTKKMILLK